jgi:hypothetical protein
MHRHIRIMGIDNSSPLDATFVLKTIQAYFGRCVQALQKYVHVCRRAARPTVARLKSVLTNNPE